MPNENKKRRPGRPKVEVHKKPKPTTTFRLSHDVRQILTALAVETGKSRTVLIESAVRELARTRGLEKSGSSGAPKPPEQQSRDPE